MKSKLMRQAFLGLCILATLHSASSYKVTIINNSEFNYELLPSMELSSTFLDGMISSRHKVAGNSVEVEADISAANTILPHSKMPLYAGSEPGYTIDLAVFIKSDCPASKAHNKSRYTSKTYEFTEFKQVVYADWNLEEERNETAYTIEFPDIHIVIDENENVHMELINKKEVTPAVALEAKAGETAATTSEVPPAAAASAESIVEDTPFLPAAAASAESIVEDTPLLTAVVAELTALKDRAEGASKVILKGISCRGFGFSSALRTAAAAATVAAELTVLKDIAKDVGLDFSQLAEPELSNLKVIAKDVSFSFPAVAAIHEQDVAKGVRFDFPAVAAIHEQDVAKGVRFDFTREATTYEKDVVKLVTFALPALEENLEQDMAEAVGFDLPALAAIREQEDIAITNSFRILLGGIKRKFFIAASVSAQGL